MSGNKLWKLSDCDITWKAHKQKLSKKLDSPRSRWTAGTNELRKNMKITNTNTVRHLASRVLSDILCCKRGKHNSYNSMQHNFCNVSTILCDLNHYKLLLMLKNKTSWTWKMISSWEQIQDYHITESWNQNLWKINTINLKYSKTLLYDTWLNRFFNMTQRC